MKTTTTNRASVLAGLTWTLSLAPPAPFTPRRLPSTPPSLRTATSRSSHPTSALPDRRTDGDLYVHGLPWWPLHLTGKGVALDAKLHVSSSGELDVTGTGVTWFP